MFTSRWLFLKERYKKPKEPEAENDSDEVKEHGGDSDEDDKLAQEEKNKTKKQMLKKEKSPSKRKKEKEGNSYGVVDIKGNCVYFKCNAPYEGKEKLCKKHLGLLSDPEESPLTLAAHLYMHTFEKVNHDMVALYHIRVLALMKDEPPIIVNVSARFSELKELSDCITKDYASHASSDAIPKFPSKKRLASIKGLFNSHENLSEDFLQQRVKELRHWMKGLLEAPKIAKQPDFHAFFGLSDPLEKVSNEELASQHCYVLIVV